MEVITKRDVIKSGVASWICHYECHTYCGSDAKLQSLRNLNIEVCSSEDVSTITGDRSLTTLTCDTCGKHVNVAVHAGPNGEYDEECGEVVCMSCLQAAVRKLQPPVVHIKTGNVYSVVGHVINATNEQSGQVMMAYERDGQMYVREAVEWSEKFEQQPQL